MTLSSEQFTSDGHTYGRETRSDENGEAQYRMKCNCGKTSRWSPLTAPLHRAQDKHADEVARRK